jgi:hypothetical protein
MVSKTYDGCWRVKILSLPSSITIDKLSETFNIPPSRIKIPREQKYTTYYAFINDFDSKKAAQDFIDQWSSSSVFGTTIRCNLIEPKNDNSNIQETASDSPESGVKAHYNRTPYHTNPKPYHDSNPNTKPPNEQLSSNQRSESNIASQNPKAPGKL